LVFNTALLAPKATRSTQGVGVLTPKAKQSLSHVTPLEESLIINQSRYRTKSIPGAGAILRPEDKGEIQLTLE
jgi:DNA gyrase subunit A